MSRVLPAEYARSSEAVKAFYEGVGMHTDFSHQLFRQGRLLNLPGLQDDAYLRLDISCFGEKIGKNLQMSNRCCTFAPDSHAIAHEFFIFARSGHAWDALSEMYRVGRLRVQAKFVGPGRWLV